MAKRRTAAMGTVAIDLNDQLTGAPKQIDPIAALADGLNCFIALEEVG